MVDFVLVILLSGICTYGWIGLEGGNKGLATIIGVQRSNRDRHCQTDIVWSSQTLSDAVRHCPVGANIIRVTVTVRNFKI
jgi:hypothetical protein